MHLRLTLALNIASRTTNPCLAPSTLSPQSGDELEQLLPRIHHPLPHYKLEPRAQRVNDLRYTLLPYPFARRLILAHATTLHVLTSRSPLNAFRRTPPAHQNDVCATPLARRRPELTTRTNTCLHNKTLARAGVPAPCPSSGFSARLDRATDRLISSIKLPTQAASH